LDADEDDTALAAKVAELSVAVRQLTDHVQVLGNAVDDLRSSIRWGLQNDKFRSPENPAIEPAEIDQEEIDATVRKACSEMSGEVADAVREGLREELREFRDSMDQYSIDVQWAARKVREKPADELNELRETLQGELVDMRGAVEQLVGEMQNVVSHLNNAASRQTQGTLFDSCVMDAPRKG
jgi:hypothetical protein